jgi:hypothetical protein
MIEPVAVVAYVEKLLQDELSNRPSNNILAIRMMFDWMVTGGSAAGITNGTAGTETPSTGDESQRGSQSSQDPKGPRRFHGSVTLNPIRLSRDAGVIADEVVQHLAKLTSANVEVTLEIDADIPDGVPDSVVRTVTENCRTLRFRIHGFEEA